MDHKDHHLMRLPALLGLLAAVVLCYLGVLYNTQVTRHEEYLTQSLHSIAQEETVEASRGIITDRSGRTLVSNNYVYNLTFDAKDLKDGEDQNQAILRLIQLCRQEGKDWEDNLPISEYAPFIYALDTTDSQQRSRFLTYLKSLDEVCDLLGAYLLEHPELAAPQEEEDAVSEEASEEETILTPSQQAKELLERFPSSALTEAVLNEAGVTAPYLVELMGRKMGLSAGFTLLENRQVLGVRYELALRKLDNYTDYVLVENVDTAFISIINDGGYAGAKITSSSVRQYETSYAAHILGYVSRLDISDDLKTLREKGYDGNDWIGRSGAESAFEEYLKGTDGRRVVSVNSDGKVTGEYYSKAPQPGNTVELTIDLELQQVVEDALAETVSKMNEADGIDSRGAGAAVIKVGTGEVLSLASYPTYDLSTFRQSDVWAELSANPAKPFNNRATQGAYPPGSTLKPLTAVAALESGVVDTNDKIRDTGRWAYPNDPTGSGAWCWFRSGHGLQNVIQAITNSCNYFFAEMGYRLGMDKFREYLTAFGLGSSTGIEIGDTSGLLPENQAGENQTPWAAFGQSNQLYSPIQLANYIATLVSGGKHYDAHLLKAVKSYDNSQMIAAGNTEPSNVVEMQDSTLEAVKKGMLGYTQPGGMVYSYFKDCVVTAGAKTGTAQLGADIENNGVFVCFAPYDEPEIALAMVIEKGGSGAALASTAVKILNAYFSADDIGTAILPENQLLP